MSDDLDLGPCCICERAGADVRNIMMLNKQAPQAGTGWGCVVCGLPNDGAVAVVCDACIGDGTDVESRLRFVIAGYASEHQRVPIAQLSGMHEHDRAQHPELAEQEARPSAILPTDTRFTDSPDAGAPTCLCSRCLLQISEGTVPIRATPADGSYEYRFHPACFGVTKTGPLDPDEYDWDDGDPDDPDDELGQPNDFWDNPFPP